MQLVLTFGKRVTHRVVKQPRPMKWAAAVFTPSLPRHHTKRVIETIDVIE